MVSFHKIYIKFVSVFCLTFATHFINQRFSTSLLPIMDILKTFLSAICSKIYFFIPFLFQFLFFFEYIILILIFIFIFPSLSALLSLFLPFPSPTPGLKQALISALKTTVEREVIILYVLYVLYFPFSMTNFKYFASVLHNGQDS